VHPWAMARWRGKVLALEMDLESGMTSRRMLTGAAMARWLSGGEGGGPVARGVGLSPGEALGPAH
jgi:hypothetical protein